MLFLFIYVKHKFRHVKIYSFKLFDKILYMNRLKVLNTFLKKYHKKTKNILYFTLIDCLVKLLWVLDNNKK